jgi:hypothetical protein
VLEYGGRRPIGRSRSRRENNIKIDVPLVGFWGIDRIYLAQERNMWQVVLNAVMNLRVT